MMPTLPPRIAAVVPTHNRKDLLGRCIQGLLNQDWPLDAILIVDNASTDGTAEMLSAHFPRVVHIRLAHNIGSSGGFSEGIKRAFADGYDWIWIMDDDAEPQSNTLKLLLEAANCLCQPAIMVCPLVVHGSSGKTQIYHHHKIGRWFKQGHIAATQLSAENATLVKLDSNAFVGPLFHRTGVEQFGLPLKEYFLLVDDLEYTYRFAQKSGCYLVPGARILHHDNPGRSIVKRYYQIRNYIHFLTRRVPLFCADKRYLKLRIAGGLLVTLILAIRSSVWAVIGRRYQEALPRLRAGLLLLQGILDGMRGKLGMRDLF